MFYKTIGFVTWKVGKAYVRRRFGGYARAGVAIAAVSIVAAGYLAARSGSES